MARVEKQKRLCNTNNIGPNLGPKCIFFKAAVQTVNDYGNPPETRRGYPVGPKTKLLLLLCALTINDEADKKSVSSGFLATPSLTDHKVCHNGGVALKFP